MTASNADRITIPELIDSVEPPTKDAIKRLPRMQIELLYLN
jgi:hypothetical protein